jgi:hypothetical protein
MTHLVKESQMQQSVADIEKLNVVEKVSSLIRIDL